MLCGVPQICVDDVADLRAIISQRKQDEDVEPLEGENYETEGAEGAEADAAMQDGGVQLSVVPAINRTVLQRRWLLKLLQCQKTLPRTLLSTQCCRIRALKGWQFNLIRNDGIIFRVGNAHIMKHPW